MVSRFEGKAAKISARRRDALGVFENAGSNDRRAFGSHCRDCIVEGRVADAEHCADDA